MRIRGGAPANPGEDTGEDTTDLLELLLTQMENDDGGRRVLRQMHGLQGNPAALEIVANNIRHTLEASQEQIAALQTRHFSSFHPSVDDVIDGKEIITLPLRLRMPRNGASIPVHMDADSLYWISTNPGELLNFLTVAGKSMVNLNSLTSRLSANTGSRFAVTGDDETILQRVGGKRPPQIKLERFPNILLAYIDSGKPGVGSHIHLTYAGLEYLTDTPYFTNIMVALVNVCFNVARKTVPRPGERQFSAPG